jgi:demethylmenaquinone methyltransferase / 2-methoxy-6-polyprenyl-1,4-benzoquinol methylase
MFDAVAQRYDLTNDVLSLGQDRRWRHDVIRAVDPQPGDRVLDLAAGTGTSSQPFADLGAAVVPCDFSLGMLRVGKQARPALPFTAGDATRLPFADATFDAVTFDAVTISFGLRNIVDPAAGLRELLCVTRLSGQFRGCHWLHCHVKPTPSGGPLPAHGSEGYHVVVVRRHERRQIELTLERLSRRRPS